jgi:hypothetical protein
MAEKIKCQFDLVVGQENYYFATRNNYEAEAAKSPPIWSGSITVEIESQTASAASLYDAAMSNMRAAEAALSEEVQKRWPGKKHSIYYWWWLKDETNGR